MFSFKRKKKIKCRHCGKKLSEWEALGFEFTVGYGSKYDGLTVRCTLCPACMDYFIGNRLTNFCEIKESF